MDHTGSAENHFFDSEGLEELTTYAYGINAIRSNVGSSGVSDEVEITRPALGPQPPDVVTGLRAKYSRGHIEITWDRVTDSSVTDIFIERTLPGRQDGGHFVHVTSEAAPATSYTSFKDSINLEPRTTYFYTIRAKNEVGVGPPIRTCQRNYSHASFAGPNRTPQDAAKRQGGNDLRRWTSSSGRDLGSDYGT